jgi:CheY-like chemotaxis protein
VGKTILVADDDRDILLILENRLQPLAYQVIISQDSLPALGLIEREKLAPSLLDLELVDQIRVPSPKTSPTTQSIPIVICMTAFGSSQR